jgi:AraC family transcriptional regulator
MTSSRTVRHADDAYGRKLAHRFGADEAPFIVTRSLPRGEIAVTEIRVDQPLGRLSDPFPPEDAYIISLLLRELPNHCYWEQGRQVSVASLRAGNIIIRDLLREPHALMDKPAHSLVFYLRRTTLNALADDANVPRIENLGCGSAVGIADETVKNLGLSLLPALRSPEQVSRQFMDHLTLAMAAHVAQTYGGMQPHPRRIQGGLAPWQERCSKDMLAGDLTGAAPLHEIARACRLSVGHFTRAFRRSTGLSPHGWLLRMRIEAAKAMLRRRDASLVQIALACGFADQSHFTRAFTRRVGTSPGAWRRYQSE